MKTIALEPELEIIAGELCAHARFEMANKLRRWARQLEVTGKMLSRPKQSTPKRIKCIDDVDMLRAN